MRAVLFFSGTLMLIANLHAGGFDWPELPSSGYIHGRAATDEDRKAGNAVFVLRSAGKLVGRPIDIAIPQYAIYIDSESGVETPVIVTQAETNGELEVIGYILIDGGGDGVALKQEFRFLGVERPVN